MKARMRLDWWLGPGRYLLLCAALFALILPRLWTDAWVGDFWIYLATVQELKSSPAHPPHPLFGNDYAFAFLSPYTWALGIAARLGRLRSFDVLIVQGFVNLALLLGALYAFVATWLRRRSAAFYALLFVLFLWGREPWQFSSFFHLRSLALVFPYPSTFAAALALGIVAAFPRVLGSGSVGWAILAVPLIAIVWILHPVNGLFLWLGVLAWSWQAPRPRRHWVALALGFGASLALAFAWPMYPVRELWFGQAGVVHEGNDAMYADPLARVAPALLGAPWLLVRLKRDRRDPLALLALALAALIAYGGVFGQWSYGRLISHAALVLQVALADASAAFEERLGRLGSPARRQLLGPFAAAALVGISWSRAVRPTLEEAGRGDPGWLSFLEDQVGRYDVVLTNRDTCWYVPGFSGKVVAYPMQLPFVPDHAERLAAVERFFEPGVAQEERAGIIERYRVAYLLFPKSHYADWEARLAELRPLGRVVYTSPDHELLRMTRPPASTMSRPGSGAAMPASGLRHGVAHALE